MKTKDLTQIALITALTIVLGMIPGIPIFIIPVPIVLQNFAIMLAGLLLGGKKGTISVLLFLILVAVGLPFLSGFRGGMAVFVGPTAGYLFAWLFTPMIISFINGLIGRYTNWNNNFGSLLIATLITSVLFTYTIAVLWLSWQSHISIMNALYANILFIPGDILKSIIAVFLAQRLIKLIK
ncbi:biotin transporter BioY [Apilactobacillus apisilvae]|uniref:Biotin transporter n=1 Tax=Apilactobacillus apisilvae TaxID=2923364 RepID=A0ABY4PFY8_9LACO|nr:biotin transporter BioY [Apilactobacillus apisilvae]UQS84578.1 biotin transporter BioY [Apilactobacillus apisilvae]